MEISNSGYQGGGMIRHKESRSDPVRRLEADDITPKVTLGEDGVLRVDFSQYDRITFASIQYVHAQHVALCPDRKIPVLIKGAGIAIVEYKAQRHLSSPEICSVVSAGAIMVNSFLERHLARMFLTYHRPPYPVQVFSDEADALAWLRGFLQKC
jgi:hypothetical protein